jgi:hypothetical protein
LKWATGPIERRFVPCKRFSHMRFLLAVSFICLCVSATALLALGASA